MSSAYYEVLRNLIFRSLVKETRLSERQIMLLRWSFIRGDKITTAYGREVQISRELADAISLLPKADNGLVFYGTSLAPNRGTDELVRQFKVLDRQKRSGRFNRLRKAISVLTQ